MKWQLSNPSQKIFAALYFLNLQVPATWRYHPPRRIALPVWISIIYNYKHNIFKKITSLKFAPKKFRNSFLS